MLLKIKQKLEQPLFLLRFIAVCICLHGLIKVFAIFAPSIVIAFILHVEGSSIFTEIVKSFSYYLDAVQEIWGIQNKATVLYLFAFSFLLSASFIVSGISLFLRKSWARKMLLSLIILVILSRFITMFLMGRFTISFMGIWDLVIYIMFFVFFTHKPIVQLFNKNA